MNRMLAIGLVAAWGAACAGSVARAQDSAPSSHMVFDDRFPGDLLVHEVRVPKAGRAMYTYYEVLGWRGPAAGYCGIQQHPRAPNFLFSIWDHKRHRRPIEAVYRGPGTETQRFGGEGTGLKSWNFKLGWKADVWYVLAARCWPVGERTHFGFWSRAGDTGRWTHLVTMAVAVPKTRFEGATDAFLEDWLNTGKQVRTTHLRGGWKRDLKGRWHPFRRARYSVNSWDLDPGKRSYNFRRQWDGGIRRDQTGGYYFMTAGGRKTRPSTANPSYHALPRDAAPAPNFRPLKINTLEARASGRHVDVRWQTEDRGAPPFAYEAALFRQQTGGKPLAPPVRKTRPQSRSAQLELPQDLPDGSYFVRLRCRDLFDRWSDWRVAKISVGSAR